MPISMPSRASSGSCSVSSDCSPRTADQRLEFSEIRRNRRQCEYLTSVEALGPQSGRCEHGSKEGLHFRGSSKEVDGDIEQGNGPVEPPRRGDLAPQFREVPKTHPDLTDVRPSRGEGAEESDA